MVLLGTLRGLSRRETEGTCSWGADSTEGSPGRSLGRPGLQQDRSLFLLGAGGLRWPAKKSPNDMWQMTGVRGASVEGKGQALQPRYQVVKGNSKAMGTLARTLTQANTKSLIWGQKGNMTRQRRTERPHSETDGGLAAPI